MLLKRNKILFCSLRESNSNFYNEKQNSTSLEEQWEQIRILSGIFGTQCLPVSIFKS